MQKLVVVVCDSSTQSRFEVHAFGRLARRVEEVLADAEGGQSLLLRGIVFERRGDGWRAYLRGFSDLTVAGGTKQEVCV